MVTHTAFSLVSPVFLSAVAERSRVQVWDPTLFIDKTFHVGDEWVQDPTTVVGGVTINDAYWYVISSPRLSFEISNLIPIAMQ
jgi:hypothetical protein